ncbi:MAG: glycerol-3-phosphate 1-O-acyltransferase PlsY [Sphingomonadaceae bacterium]|nr:glycerol-3-phosphate 1-O-acyltransferase PlsY [Sphingomonadaceae bacterium]
MSGQGWPALLVAAVIGYFLGSIPFGLLLTRAAGAGDLRAIGSGNIGATNVLRTGRKELAAATLILDALKGAAAVLIVRALFGGQGVAVAPALIAGGAAFLGHLFPVWLGFRGGKGVATYLGIVCALHWPSALVFAVVWLLAMLVTRYSSVGGMSAAVATPVVSAACGHFDLVVLLLPLTLLVLFKHRANIERLLEGTEPRIGSRGA